MPDQELYEEIVKRISQLEGSLAALSVKKPKFEILNVAPSENITIDQNNYALGDYDLLLLNPTANRIIYGITGGVAGRHLHIRNSSQSFTLTLQHQDATATAANRIVTASAAPVILGVRQWAHLVYISDAIVTGTTRWLLLYPSS